jgi:hypothetical protein
MEAYSRCDNEVEFIHTYKYTIFSGVAA